MHVSGGTCRCAVQDPTRIYDQAIRLCYNPELLFQQTRSDGYIKLLSSFPCDASALIGPVVDWEPEL